VSAVYGRLLNWQSGQPGATADLRTVARTDPTHADLQVACGASTAEAHVWVVHVSLALQADVITLNSDYDKAGHHTAGQQDDDLQQQPSGSRDDDLKQMTLKIEPDGVPGTVGLSALTVNPDDQTTSAGRVGFFTTAGKDAALSSSWDLWGTDAPAEQWVEGQALSAHTGDQAITLTYTFAGLTLSAGTTTTVQAPSGTKSSARLRLYTLTYDGSGVPHLDVPKTSPLGGTVGVVLEVTLGPGDRLPRDGTDTLVTPIQHARVADTWTGYTNGASAAYTYDFTMGAGTWEAFTEDGTGTEVWGSDGTPAGVDGTQAVAKHFRLFHTWDTVHGPTIHYPGVTQLPWPDTGHNGKHALTLAAADGSVATDMAFQHYNALQGGWQTPYTAKVDKLTGTVKNLVISKVDAGQWGTQDYIKYDPEDGAKYHRPQVTFQFDDQGDTSGTYHCWLMLQRTGASGKEFEDMGDIYAYADAYVQDNATPTSKTLPWTGRLCQWNNDRTYTETADDMADWGTYAYDVIVEKYDSHGNTIDSFAYKAPYCLSISNDPVYGHDVWINSTNTGDELRCFYSLYDYAADQLPYAFEEPSSVTLQGIDNNLDIAGGSLPWGSLVGPYYDNILVDTASEMRGVWRVVFTGTDTCWMGYRRDHSETRMLAVNKATQKNGPIVFGQSTPYIDKEVNYDLPQEIIDRAKQLSKQQLDDIIIRANLNVTGAPFMGYPITGELLKHYLSNTGTEVGLSFIPIYSYDGDFRSEVDSIRKQTCDFSENSVHENGTHNITLHYDCQVREESGHILPPLINKSYKYICVNSSQDYSNSIGHCHLFMNGIVTKTRNEFRLVLAYYMRDSYQFEDNGKSGGLVTDTEMVLLEGAGKAKRFSDKADGVMVVKWVKGSQKYSIFVAELPLPNPALPPLNAGDAPAGCTWNVAFPNITFRWNAMNGASSYKLKVAISPLGLANAIEWPCTGISYSTTFQQQFGYINPQQNMALYWQVKAINNQTWDESLYSAVNVTPIGQGQ